jgi:hypothetical protein
MVSQSPTPSSSLLLKTHRNRNETFHRDKNVPCISLIFNLCYSVILRTWRSFFRMFRSKSLELDAVFFVCSDLNPAVFTSMIEIIGQAHAQEAWATTDETITSSSTDICLSASKASWAHNLCWFRNSIRMILNMSSRLSLYVRWYVNILHHLLAILWVNS